MKKILIFSMMLVLFGSDALAFDPAEALKKKREREAQQAAAELRGGRYGEVQVHDNGTVTIQGKQWMRCSLGQQWTGSTCTGTAVEATWGDAQEMAELMNQAGGFAGFRDWRVPTIAELELLRLCSSGRTQAQTNIPGKGHVFSRCDGEYRQPTIEATLFPNTPTSAWFWSSSPYAGSANGVWSVYFGNGTPGFDYKGYGRVRLVRAGQ